MTEAERERAIRTLRERYARGSLTHDEFDDALGRVMAADSSEELDELLPARNGFDDPAPPSTATDMDAVERHLSAGERVEWVGRPDPSRHFTRGDVFLIPFSIMWGGFAIFWEGSVLVGGGGPFFVLWGIPFVVIGLYFMFGRFIYKANRKRRTIYAVSNKRVMTIVRGRRGESVDATYLRSIPNISTSAVSNGRGSVEFGLSSPMAGWYANSGMEFFARSQMASSGISFYDIEDPRGVADLVERLRDEDRSR
jgi:uncharacterized membrane protein